MPTQDATAHAGAPHRIVWVSTSDTGHLDLHCSGLNSLREAGRDPAEYLERRPCVYSLIEVFDPDDGRHEVRPCRMCALEHALIEMFRDTPIRQPGTRFVITSLAAKARWKAWRSSETDAEREHRAQLEAAADQRLLRVAAAAGLTTTTTAGGAVMYGKLPIDVAETLDKRVQTFSTWATPGRLPSEEVVRVFAGLIRSSGIDKQQAWITAQDIAS